LAKRTRSAQKQARQSERRKLRNRARKLTLKQALKDLAAAKDKTEAAQQLPKVQSIIDRSARHGVIRRKAASRIKSKLAARVSDKP
jgi:small subunit ribosomal protein S20